MLNADADARNRAWRTLVQGLGIDLAVALLLAIGPSLVGNDFAWSTGYWRTLGLLAAKTAIQTLVSYAARKLVPPPE